MKKTAMTKRMKLPVDIQAFETIRENNYLYVDKTRWVQNMTEDGRYYFLSRPRRFGKSLLVSVLKCLFQGRKELFDGLDIAEHGAWKWQEHPVILIDFNSVSHDTPENFRTGLKIHLKSVGRHYGVSPEASLLKEYFSELILMLHEKTKMPVVILIDEYDKPITDHLGKGDDAMRIAEENRDILKSFLGVLKGGEVAPFIRFVFITGVSKFSQVSIFSELNNLIDLTMSDTYADLLGYTQEELDTQFEEYMAQFADKLGISETAIREKLKRWYDGYRFSDKDIRVYNPFSVLRALSNAKFRNYWFETGTPTFLINLLRERAYPLPNIESLQVSERIFSAYDLERLGAEALLFQTGYVTIKDVKDRTYILDYPNQEVKTSFMEHLLHSFSEGKNNEENSKFLLLSEYLDTEDFEAFFETITAIFASISYTLSTQRDESHFFMLFYLMVCASGADARSEVLISRGRIDLVVELSDKIFVMEFKCNQSAEDGIRQIVNKGYAEKYRSSDKKLFLMGINFSSEKKNIAEWKIEVMK